MAIFLTFILETNDPHQADFANRLREMIESVPVKMPAGRSAERSEGVQLNKKGEGSLMFHEVERELQSLNHCITTAYRNEEGNKITFVAEADTTKYADEELIGLFRSLTDTSGWTVRRYSNPKGVAFSAMNPVDKLPQARRATAKAKVFEVVQVSIL